MSVKILARWVSHVLGYLRYKERGRVTLGKTRYEITAGFGCMAWAFKVLGSGFRV